MTEGKERMQKRFKLFGFVPSEDSASGQT